MDSDGKRILDWVIGKITSEFKNDVALLVGHGEGSGWPSFQSEFDYFIPNTQRAYNLSKNFIINGVCYDLYPRSWESVEMIADLRDDHTSCLAEADILYAGNEEDAARFESMRKKLHNNLADKRFTSRKAFDRLAKAMYLYQKMVFSDKPCDIRASAGFILDNLAQAVALLNGRYFKFGPLYQIEEMETFEIIPGGFTAAFEEVIKCADAVQMKWLCHRLIVTVRKFLRANKPANSSGARPDYRRLADWYQELCHLWRKIYASCENYDTNRVFIWGCMLQHELDIIREEFNLNEMDLMSVYSASNFTPVRRRAEKIERYITGIISKNNISVEIYNNADDFLRDN